MADQETQRYCATCNRLVLARRPGINHVLHLLLTVLTCSAWAVVWGILVFLRFGGWRCTVCGGAALRLP